MVPGPRVCDLLWCELCVFNFCIVVLINCLIFSAHVNSMLGSLNHRSNLRSARSEVESGASADLVHSGYSNFNYKTHSRNGSFQPAHLRGLSYSTASPPTSTSPLRTPPTSAGLMLQGLPGKSGWPTATEYPPSGGSNTWVPTHQASLTPA